MITYQTIEAAQQAASGRADLAAIIEARTFAHETVYLIAKVGLATLRQATRQRPLPGISMLIAEHPVRCEPAIRTEARCERCGRAVDPGRAYQQSEWTRFGGARVTVIAYYCEPCRTLLTSIGTGERTDLDARR